MFTWFDLRATSRIDTSLEKDDVTPTELMDEEDVLQECKALDRKLDLVNLITREPCSDTDEKLKYKYPNISCELLTCDVAEVNNWLGEDEALRMKLYGFLQNDPPQPSVGKFLQQLLGRSHEQEARPCRLEEQPFLLKTQIIGTSAIMDLLLRMLTCIEPQHFRRDVLNVKKVVQQLVDMVQPSQDEDVVPLGVPCDGLASRPGCVPSPFSLLLCVARLASGSPRLRTEQVVSDDVCVCVCVSDFM
uniref:Uncharacterized protein n=1 Tax=Scleropages formosus TaxID=113540 RepID=A0A8C9RKT3_SCLFO